MTGTVPSVTKITC